MGGRTDRRTNVHAIKKSINPEKVRNMRGANVIYTWGHTRSANVMSMVINE